MSIYFIKTDERCVIGNISYPGIPVFLKYGHGFLEDITGYMIYLSREKRHPSTTVQTYAFQIQKYLKFLESIGQEWKEATDQTLLNYRDFMFDYDGIVDKTISSNINTVFGLYVWAEEKGIIRNCVAIYGDKGSIDKAYRISASKKAKSGWTWRYMPSVKHRADRSTPTPRQLEEVHVRAFEDSETGQRDSLILSFYEDVGLRKSELLNLTVNDIPGWEDIEKAMEESRAFTVKILGKGSKIRYVEVLPELMRRTREYIEEDRAQVISAARRRNPAYRPPECLLLSYTNGHAINSNYLSARISELLKSAGIQDASGHRVRATYIETQVEAYDGHDTNGNPLPAELVLWKVGEKVGHNSPLSTRSYLNKVRSRSFTSAGDQILDKTNKLNDLTRKIAEKSGALKSLEVLSEVASAIREGDNEAALASLMRLVEKIDNEF